MSLRLLSRRKAAREAEPEELGDEPLLLSGDARIDGGAAFPTGLAATSSLTLGRGARVRGSVRVGATLVLERDALLEGDATVEGDAIVEPGARIEGRLVCRRLLLRGEGGGAGEEPARRVEPQGGPPHARVARSPPP